MKGNGVRSFTFIPPNQAGISVEGELRDVVVINLNGAKHLLAGRNNSSIEGIQEAMRE